MLHEAFLIIIIIMEIFNVSVIQIYKQNHCSLVTPSMKLHSKNFDVHSSDICQKKRIDMTIPGICGR